MDFHSLSRKDLQTLCKKNKIPANMTNVAMADELKALQHVEGLEEFLNRPESDCQLLTQSVPRTATRTSTRQKPVKEAPGSSVVTSTRSRRMTRPVIAEEIEQEYKNVNSIMTPAVPTTRRRAPAASNQKRVEMKNGDDDNDEGKTKISGPETPAVPSSRRRGTVRTVSKKMETPHEGNSLQKVYSTRRSVRLLEKSIADLSLEHTEQIGCTKTSSTSETMIDASEKSHEEVQKELSFETESSPFSESSDEIEVRSVEKKTGDEIGSSDFESKLDLCPSEGSQVLGNSDISDIPENKKEVDVSDDTEDNDINYSLPDIGSHPYSERVNEKHSSSDDSAEAIKGVSAEVMWQDDTVGGVSLVLSASDESISKYVAVDPNADILDKSDKYESQDVEERSFRDDNNLKSCVEEFAAQGNSDAAKFSKANSEIDAPGGQRDIDEHKDCPSICTESVANLETSLMPLTDPMSCPMKPEKKVEPEMTELSEKSKKDTENIVSDNHLPSQFPRPIFSTHKNSVGEKEVEKIFDEEEDGETKSKKDTVKEIMICNELQKLSLRSLRREIKKKVEEKRTALLPLQQNRMSAAEVQNKNQDV